MNHKGVCALWFTTLLFVSGPTFGQSCDLPIHKDGFEFSHVSTYNDPTISGATDDGRNFTRVPGMGLDWLDLNLTFNLSTNAVKLRIADPSDELFGLRYASLGEVNRLLGEFYDLPLGVRAGTEIGMAFIENFGEGIVTEGVHIVIGFFPRADLISTTEQQLVSYDCLQNQSARAGGFITPNDVSQFGAILQRKIALDDIRFRFAGKHK